MTREELINQCRYYKGAETSLDADGLFCDYEEWYVNHNGKINEVTKADYENLGGKKFPDVPYGILLILFNRWQHWLDTGNLQDFYEFLEEYISKAPKYH